jgi:hypothetical protein
MYEEDCDVVIAFFAVVLWLLGRTETSTGRGSSYTFEFYILNSNNVTRNTTRN